MTNPKINYLKQNGFKIRINHYRAFQRTNGSIITAPPHFKKDKSLKILNGGGFCYITVFKGDKLIETSISYCNPSDVYYYSLGVSKAVNKLKIKVEKEFDISF